MCPCLPPSGIGNPALSWAALIGFWVALVDPGWPPRSRLLTIGAFTVGSAAGCFAAVLLRPYVWPSGAFALVWCFAAILTRVWGDAVGATGNLAALATLIILGADQPSSAAAAAEMAVYTVGGGLWGLLLAFGIGRRRPEAPLRVALAAVFREEAAFVRDLARGGPQQQRRGAVREAIESARLLLVSARGRWFGGNTAAQGFTLLLSDAEGGLRALLALREALDDAASPAAPPACERAGGSDGRNRRGAVRRPARPRHRGAGRARDDARRRRSTRRDRLDRRRPAAPGEPAEQAVPANDPDAVQRDGWLRQIRDNLTAGSLSLRHAVRFALTGAVLTMLTKGLRIEMGYWITITAVIILQAYPSATWQRAIQRVGGTLLGGLIAVGTASSCTGRPRSSSS